MTDNEIVKVRIAVPGPAGTGMTAAEKTSYDSRLNAAAADATLALAIAQARFPISVQSEYGGGTPNISTPVVVPNLTGTAITLPAGTWAVQLMLSCHMIRSVTGDPAGGYGFVELLFDSTSRASALPSFLYIPINIPVHTTVIADIVGIAAGAHTVSAQFRGHATAGTTNIANLRIVGVARRTA